MLLLVGDVGESIKFSDPENVMFSPTPPGADGLIILRTALNSGCSFAASVCPSVRSSGQICYHDISWTA